MTTLAPRSGLLQIVIAPLARLMPELSNYTIVSVVALGVDLAVFNGLVIGGMRASLAGVIGYSVGLVVHCLLYTSDAADE